MPLEPSPARRAPLRFAIPCLLASIVACTNGMLESPSAPAADRGSRAQNQCDATLEATAATLAERTAPYGPCVRDIDCVKNCHEPQFGPPELTRFPSPGGCSDIMLAAMNACLHVREVTYCMRLEPAEIKPGGASCIPMPALTSGCSAGKCVLRWLSE